MGVVGLERFSMITFEKLINKVNICCDVIPMGEDLTVLLYGGDLPHIGSTVLSIPRASLTGDGLSTTSSVLNCLGHKDDVLARIYAEKIAVKSNHTTVCICGIHVDGLSGDGIKAIYDGCLLLLDEVLSAIGNENLLLSSYK